MSGPTPTDRARGGRRMGRMAPFVLLVSAALFAVGPTPLLGSGPASAQPTCTTTFTGGDVSNPTSWNDALNWSSDSVPGPSDVACISSPTTDVQVSAPVDVGAVNAPGVEIDLGTGTNTFELSDPSDQSSVGFINNESVTNILTVDSGVTAAVGLDFPYNGEVDNEGSLTISQQPGNDLPVGDLTLVGGGVTTLASSDSLQVDDNSSFVVATTLDNAGTLEWTAGTFEDNGTIDNTGTIDLALLVPDSLTGSPESNLINEASGIITDTNIPVTVAVPLENEGTIDVERATLTLDEGGGASPDTGQFDVASGTSLVLASGSYTFATPASESGGGTVEFAPGATISGDLAIDGTVEDSGGWITGPSTTIDIASSGTFDISNSFQLLDGATIDNAGTLNWTDGLIVTQAGTTLDNSGNFNIDLTEPDVLDGNPSPGDLINEASGTITDTGPYAAEIETSFENDGTVDVDGTGTGLGELQISGPSGANPDSGAYVTGVGATLDFNGSIVNHDNRYVGPSATFTGAGTVEVDGSGISFSGNTVNNLSLMGGEVVAPFTMTGDDTLSAGVITSPVGAPTTVTVASSATVALGNSNANLQLLGGTTFDNTGTVEWLTGNWLLGDGSIVENSGTLNIELIFSGFSIQPANASGSVVNEASGIITDTSTAAHAISVPFENAGLITLSGAPLGVGQLQLDPTSTVQIVVTSPSAAGELTTSSPGQLAGNLVVTAGNGFDLSSGAGYTVVECSPCSGGFAQVVGPVTATQTSGAVFVVVGTPGPTITEFANPLVYTGGKTTFFLAGTGLSSTDTVSAVGPGSVTVTKVSGTSTTLDVSVAAAATDPAAQWLLVVKNPAGEATAATFEVTPIAQVTPQLPDGFVGESYTDSPVTFTAGTSPYIVKAIGLPRGMHISSTGVVSGIPPAVGTYTFTITVADSSVPRLATVRTVSIHVDRGSPGLTLAVSPPLTALYGGKVALVARVTGTSSVTPDVGTIAFFSNGEPVTCTSAFIARNKFLCDTTADALGLGTDTLTAYDYGDGNYQPATSAPTSYAVTPATAKLSVRNSAVTVSQSTGQFTSTVTLSAAPAAISAHEIAEIEAQPVTLVSSLAPGCAPGCVLGSGTLSASGAIFSTTITLSGAQFAVGTYRPFYAEWNTDGSGNPVDPAFSTVSMASKITVTP